MPVHGRLGEAKRGPAPRLRPHHRTRRTTWHRLWVCVTGHARPTENTMCLGPAARRPLTVIVNVRADPGQQVQLLHPALPPQGGADHRVVPVDGENLLLLKRQERVSNERTESQLTPPPLQESGRDRLHGSDTRVLPRAPRGPSPACGRSIWEAGRGRVCAAAVFSPQRRLSLSLGAGGDPGGRGRRSQGSAKSTGPVAGEAGTLPIAVGTSSAPRGQVGRGQLVSPPFPVRGRGRSAESCWSPGAHAAEDAAWTHLLGGWPLPCRVREQVRGQR